MDLQAQHPEWLYADLLTKAHQVLEDRLKALSDNISTSTTLEGDPATTFTPTPTSTSGHTSPPPSDPHVAFGKSIKDWPIFPDSSEALHALARHYKLVVLSNVDHSSFAHTHAHLSTGISDAPLSVYSRPSVNTHKYWFPRTIPGSMSPFTLILTAQDTGKYKPDLEGFNYALETIQNDPLLLNGASGDVRDSVLIVAQSLTHDIVPATKLDLKSVWIDRKGAAMGLDQSAGAAKWGWKFETLGEMAEAVEKEVNFNQ